EDLGELVEADLDLELFAALVLAGLALPLAFPFALTDLVADFALALADTPALVVAKDETRDVDVWHRDRDPILAFASDHVSPRDIAAQVLSNPTANDLTEAAMVLVDTRDERHGRESPGERDSSLRRL